MTATTTYRQGMPKLTEQQVSEIYRRSWDGEFARPLAAEYGVHEFTIRSIKNKRTWKALTDKIDAGD
jgi:hypothetical protein